MITAGIWSLLAVDCLVCVLVVADNGGLAPHTDLPGLVEVHTAQRHEELRPGGVEASLVVEGNGVGDDVTTVSLADYSQVNLGSSVDSLALYLLIVDKPAEISSWFRLVGGTVEVEEISRGVIRLTSLDSRGLRWQRQHQEVSVLTLSGEHWGLGGGSIL